MSHALPMLPDFAYQAGMLEIYLENAPAASLPADLNADSVFPEPYAFALSREAAPSPLQASPEPELEEEDEAIDLSLLFEQKQGEQPEEEEEEELPPAQAVPEDLAWRRAPHESQPLPTAPEAVAAAVAEAAPVEPAVEPYSPPTSVVGIPAAAPLQAGCVRPFLPIAGAPAGGIPQDFSLEVQTADGSTEIEEGALLVLNVRASQACQIVIMCREEDGTSSMLYPNKHQTAEAIPANEWVQLPPDGTEHYEFRIEGPSSLDTLQIIARQAQKNGLHRTTAAEAKKRAEEQRKNKRGRRPIGQKPANTALWSYALLELHVCAEGETWE